MTSFKDLPFKQKIKFILALWGACSSFFLIAMLLFITIPADQEQLINTLVTLYVTGSIVNVYTFYFGDSDAVGE